MAPPIAETTAMSWKSPLTWVAVLVTLAAVILAVPQPSWNWDTDVLPLARQYSSSSKKISKVTQEDTSSVPLQGVVVVITGATSGIGLGLAKVLTRLGAHVVAVGRSPTKLLHLVQDLQEQQQDKVKITTIVGDLEDLASIARASNEINSKFPRIDILINNAGIHRGMNLFNRSVTPQGYDLAFGVNYLSHFLLTEKLLPKLLKSQKPRIVQISSTYHFTSDGSDLLPPSSGVRPIAAQPGGSTGWIVFRTQRQYSNSKLAQILHARALLRQYPLKTTGTDNTTTTWIRSACPAWVGTNIGGHPGSFVHWVLNRLGYSVEGYGLASILQAVLSDDDNNNSNKQNVGTHKTFSNDFFANTYWTTWVGQVFLQLDWLVGHPLVYQSGLRDLIANAAAGIMLLTQKLVPYSGPSPSSPESYHVDAQDQLYQWSREAVRPWL